MNTFVQSVFGNYNDKFGNFYVSHYGDNLSVFEKNGVTIGYVKGTTEGLPVAKPGFIFSAYVVIEGYGSFGIQFFSARADQNDINLYCRSNVNEWTVWRKLTATTV